MRARARAVLVRSVGRPLHADARRHAATVTSVCCASDMARRTARGLLWMEGVDQATRGRCGLAGRRCESAHVPMGSGAGARGFQEQDQSARHRPVIGVRVGLAEAYSALGGDKTIPLMRCLKSMRDEDALTQLYQPSAILQATRNQQRWCRAGVTLALINAENFVGRGSGFSRSDDGLKSQLDQRHRLRMCCPPFPPVVLVNVLI